MAGPTSKATPDVAALARAKWNSSGITDEEAKSLKLTAVNSAAVLAPNLTALPALHIPYWTLEGKPSAFFRVRYLKTPSGLAGLIAKPQRYAQPAGTLNEVYLPPMFQASWKNIADDPDISIVITEGELKAASACARGLACIGLGGVDVWRSSKRGLMLLPQLEAFNWDGRTVYVVFDSDAATNPNVVRAQTSLSKELTARGAKPAIISLPPTEDGAKQGLDDWLVAQGEHHDRAWTTLELDARPYSEATALWDLNTEVCYINDPGIVVVMSTNQRMSPAAFSSHAYSNRHYMQQGLTQGGKPKTERMPAAPAWLEWERRYSLQKMIYEPGQPPVTGRNEYNLWTGWGTQPKKGDVRPWRELLDYMFMGDREARTWFEQWCAYPLQHPGEKMFSAIAIWGREQGTGKTMIGATLRRIYGSNGSMIEDSDLEGDYNDWAENKQFVLGDEVTGSDSRGRADRLKGLITRETVRINVKYVPKYELRDCINYYFTSNHPDAFFLEDKDRRFFIWETPHRPLPREFYAELYVPWMKGDGPAHLFHHLLNLNLKGFDPHGAAHETDAKRAMIMDGKSELSSWVASMHDEPDRYLLPLGEKVAKGCDLLTAEQIRTCYDPEHATKVTAVGMGKELKRSGMPQVTRGVPVRTVNGMNRLYIVRNPGKWLSATTSAAGLHWSEFFGPKTPKFKSRHKVKGD